MRNGDDVNNSPGKYQMYCTTDAPRRRTKFKDESKKSSKQGKMYSLVGTA